MGLFTDQKLQTKTGLVDADGALKDNVILVYFSAHWCPPCRSFTPLLKEFFEKLVKDYRVTIVFVSSDQSASDMKSYFENDHGDWLAVPFDNKDLSAALKKKCGVSGIPKLCVVDGDGNMLSGDARADVQKCTEQAAFKKWQALKKA